MIRDTLAMPSRDFREMPLPGSRDQGTGEQGIREQGSSGSGEQGSSGSLRWKLLSQFPTVLLTGVRYACARVRSAVTHGF